MCEPNYWLCPLQVHCDSTWMPQKLKMISLHSVRHQLHVHLLLIGSSIL